MLDWDDLRYFLAVVKDGSLSAAARSLGVAQPTVGRRVAAFEQRLGAKLFNATPKGQVLSVTGQRMLAHVEQMEREALAAFHVARGRDSGLSGAICLTSSEWMVQSVLGPMFAPFMLRHPQIQLELLAETRHLNLVRREADLAIRPSAFEHREVVQVRLGSIAFGLYASDSYLATRGAPNFERQCEGHHLIAMSETLTKIPDVTWLPQVAARAQVIARCNGRQPMVVLAAAGVGLACLPRFIGDATPALRLVSVREPGPWRPLWLGVNRQARKIPRVRACIEFASQRFAALQPSLHPELP